MSGGGDCSTMPRCYCELPYSECADSQPGTGMGNNPGLPTGVPAMDRSRRVRLLPMLAALLAAPAAGAAEPVAVEAPERPKTTQELLDASLPTDWRRP